MVYYIIAEKMKKSRNAFDVLANEVSFCFNKCSEIKVKLESLEEMLEIRLTEDLKISEVEIEKINNTIDVLKDLNLKLKKIKNIFTDTNIIKVIEAIDVNERSEGNNLYGLLNGLVDVNRDILMKLIELVFDDKVKIRNIIGMSSIFYSWSKKRYFLLIARRRMKCFCVDLTGTLTISKNRSEFKETCMWYTAFVDFAVRNSTYKIDFKVVRISCGCAKFGFCTQSQKLQQQQESLGCGLKSGGVYLYHNVYIACCGGASYDSGTNHFSLHPYGDGSIISVELNALAHTAHFFVDGKIFPDFISNVPDEPLLFAVSGLADPISVVVEIMECTRLTQTDVPTNTLLTARPIN